MAEKKKTNSEITKIVEMIGKGAEASKLMKKEGISAEEAVKRLGITPTKPSTEYRGRTTPRGNKIGVDANNNSASRYLPTKKEEFNLIEYNNYWGETVLTEKGPVRKSYYPKDLTVVEYDLSELPFYERPENPLAPKKSDIGTFMTNARKDPFEGNKKKIASATVGYTVGEDGKSKVQLVVPKTSNDALEKFENVPVPEFKGNDKEGDLNLLASYMGADTFDELNQETLTILGKIYDDEYVSNEELTRIKPLLKSNISKLNAYQSYYNLYGGTDLSKYLNLYSEAYELIPEAKTYYNRFDDKESFDIYKRDVGVDIEGLSDKIIIAVQDMYAAMGYDNPDEYAQSKGYKDFEDLKNYVATNKELTESAMQTQGYNKYEQAGNPESKYYDPEFDKYAEFVDPGLPAISTSNDFQSPINPEEGMYRYVNADKTGLSGDEILAQHNMMGTHYASGVPDMTEEEIRTYNYWYNKFGPEKAEEYLSSIEAELAERYAPELASKHEGDFSFAFQQQFASGLEGLRKAPRIFGIETGKAHPTAQDYATDIIREGIEDEYGTIGTVGYDLVGAIGGEIPEMVVSGVNPWAGAVYTGISAAGNAYQQALADGYSEDEAQAYSIMSGIVTGSIDKLLGTVGNKSGLGTKWANNIARISDDIDNALLRVAVKTGGNAAGEALEGAVEQIIDPYLQNIATNGEANAKIDWEQVLYDGIMEGLAGAAISLPGTIASDAGRSTYLNKTGKKVMNNPTTFTRMMEVGSRSSDPKVYSFVKDVKDGKPLSAKDVGKGVERIIADSVTRDGGMINIMNLTATIDGKGSGYVGSMESIDTAKAVMHFVQGKATDTDNALISRSTGATTLLTAIEGNSKAWDSIDKAAGRELRSEAPVQNAEYGVRNEKNSSLLAIQNDGVDNLDNSVGNGVRYKISYTTENEPVVVIENDILDGVNKKNWVEKTKEAITKFKPGIKVSGRFIKVNAQTTGEYLHSDYTDSLKKSDKVLYKDKLNAAGHLDEIILSSRNYINEDLKHERTDNIKEFARGDVLLQIGKNKYKASVVVGFTKGNEMVLYDIVDINNTNFETKKAGDSERTLNKSSQLRQESPTKDRVPQKDGSVNNYSMRDGEVYSQGKKVDIPKGVKTGSNIVLDEESRAFRKKNPEGYRVIATMAKDLGMKVKFVKGLFDSDGNELGGIITSKGIFINTEADDPTRFAVTHEFGHRMRDSAPKQWAKYQNYVIDRLKNTPSKTDGVSKYEERYEEKRKYYKEHQIDEEIACDYVGTDLINDVNELKALIQHDGKLAQFVRKVCNWVLDRLGLDVEKQKVQQLWQKAYLKAVGNVEKGKVESKGEAKKSVSETRETGLNNSSDGDIVDINDKICVIPKQNIVFAGMYDAMNSDKEFNSLYKAGKNGDIEAAKEISKKYITDNYLKTFSEKYKNVTILPVIGAESTTTNVLPQYIASYIAEITSCEYRDDIYKISKNNFRTGKKTTANRLTENIEFAFSDEKSKNIKGNHFVIFDDCISTGTTVNALREFIERNGGIVDGFASLAKGRDNTDNIAITREQFKQLKELMGDEYSYEISKITARQADALIRSEKLRNGIFDRTRIQGTYGDKGKSEASIRERGETSRDKETRGTEKERRSVNKKSISGTRLSDVERLKGENAELRSKDAKYAQFLNENGGGLQAFRPSAESGWLSQQWIASRSEGNEKAAKSLNQIADIVTKELGIPVTKKKFEDDNVSGNFNPTSEVIHTRARNDVITLSHEVGHFLDKKLGMQKFEGIDDLVANFDKTLAALGYSENAKKSESVGEFVRMYLTNKDVAKTFAPEFYQEFEKELTQKGYKKTIDNLAKEINSYLSSTTSERVALAISEDIDARTGKEKAKDIVTMENVRQSLVAKKDKFPDLWKNLNRSMIDSFYDIGQVQGRVYAKNPDGKNDAHMLATNSLNSAARSAYILTKSFVNMDGEEVGSSFIDCLTPIHDKNSSKRAKNISALNRYLVLKHALEWVEPITTDKTGDKKIKSKRVFADETLNDPAVIREEIAKTETELPSVKEAAENIYRYIGNLKKYWGVDTGLITNELSGILDEMYPCYVPFYRESKNKGKKGARISLANQRAPILEATGGEGLIVNPLESIINLTEKYVKTASRNMSMQALAHMADNIEGTGFVIERADGKIQKTLENESEIYTNTENKAKAEPEEIGVINTEEDNWKKEYSNGKGYVSVLVNGEKVWYQINDENLFNAVANMEPKKLNAFLRGCNTVLQVKRALITSNNPLFAATNAVRDAITAYNNIDINNPFSYLRSYFAAFAHVIKKDSNYKRWCAMGGGHSSELSANMNDVSRALNKALRTSTVNKIMNSILHPIELIASINDIVESTPRLMAFEHEMKKSGDVHRAINKADDITTNFKRGGTTAKALNNVFMFSNAQIQGLDRTIRSFTKSDTPNGRRNRVIKYAVMATLLTVIQQVLNRRDDETEEEYKNLSKYMKRSNYVISIGDGEFLRIPTAREQDLLRVIITDCVDYAFGDKEAFDGLTGFVIDAVWPWYVEIPTDIEGKTGTDVLTEMVINTARNTPFGTFTDFAANSNYTGAPIVPAAYEDLPPEEQYDEKTSKLAVFLGELTGNSPFKIDYIINNNLGILGTLNKSLFPVDDSQKDYSLGFKSRWVADSYYSTDVFNKVYEKRDAAELQYKRYDNGENLSEYSKTNAAAMFVTQCNKAIKNLPENEKREARGRLLTIMNEWGNGDSQATEELIRLYDTTGEDLFFKLSPISVTTFDGKRNMTFDEYISYAENYTAAHETVLGEIISSEAYRNMTDEEKVAVIERATTFAEDSSKAEVLPDYELENWQMDIIKNDGDISGIITSESSDVKLDNIGKELYEDFSGSSFNETKYSEEVERYIAEGYSEEEIQSAVNRAGKDTPEYKNNYQTQYFAIEIDSEGLSSEVKSEAESYIPDAAEYFAGKETIPGFKGDKFMEVYGEKLSDDMDVGEFLSVKAYAKTEAITWDEDGSDKNLSKDELERYLDSTDYSQAVKGALFQAIGNSTWYNKYTGLKNNGEPRKSSGGGGGKSGSSGGSSGRSSSTNRSSGVTRIKTSGGTSGTRGTFGTRGTSGTRGTR